MNTKIARRLSEAVRKSELKKTGEETVMAHNVAVANGFIELPILDCKGATSTADGTVTVAVAPRCGIMSVDDLWALKQTWGADRLEVCDEGGMAVLLTYKR